MVTVFRLAVYLPESTRQKLHTDLSHLMFFSYSLTTSSQTGTHPLCIPRQQQVPGGTCSSPKPQESPSGSRSTSLSKGLSSPPLPWRPPILREAQHHEHATISVARSSRRNDLRPCRSRGERTQLRRLSSAAGHAAQLHILLENLTGQVNPRLLQRFWEPNSRNDASVSIFPDICNNLYCSNLTCSKHT